MNAEGRGELPAPGPSADSEAPLRGALAQGTQILVGALGGLLFHVLGVPAAWLSGPVVAVVLWGASGLGRPVPRPVADAAMLLSGANMGAAVTPEALAAVGRYPLSLAVLVLGMAAITAASMLWLVRVSGWQRDDALLASAPGAFSAVLAVAIDRNADVPQIAVVQVFRIFVLVTLLPSAIVLVGGGGGSSLLEPGAEGVASPSALAVALVGGLGLGLAFQRLGIAAPILLGAAVVSTVLHAGAWAPGRMPTPIATAGLVLLGVFIAQRFRILERGAVRRTMVAAVGSFLVSMAAAAAFAVLAALLAQVGIADALVAFAPGGLEAMMVLALVLGLDPLYVGVHHLARFLGIGFLLPVVFTWLRRR